MKKLFFLLPTLLFINQISAQVDSAWYTSFDGRKIYYEVKGIGKPILLVHGFIVNSSTWKKAALYTSLQEAGYQVITADLRGNGKSDKPHDAASYANDAEAKDLMGLLTQLGIKQYDVLGYSRGSIITARLLALDKRVNKAVLGGMGTDFTNPNWPRRIMFYRALSGDSIPELKGVVEYVQKAGLDQTALALLQKEQPSTSKETLSKVKQPILVICGAEDADNGSAGELAKLFPHATLATVPGNHNNAASTTQFANAVIEFLKR